MFWTWEKQQELLPEIEKWEKRTEQAMTDEEVATAIETYKKELISSYTLFDLIIILECGFDRTVRVWNGWKNIPYESLIGDEKVCNITMKEWYAYIEI